MFECLSGCFSQVSSVTMPASLLFQLAETPRKSFSKFSENKFKQFLRVCLMASLSEIAGGKPVKDGGVDHGTDVGARQHNIVQPIVNSKVRHIRAKRASCL